MLESRTMESEVRPKLSKEYGVTFKEPVKDPTENENNTEPAKNAFIEPNYPSTSSSSNYKPSKYEKYEREKIGHRRVTETGQVTYKKKPTSELMAAMILGIGQSIGGLSSKPERDLLMQDFAVVESVFFPAEGSNLTPAHTYSDFRFKTYAPMAFRYFRELFGIQPDDFLYSICNECLVELSNPGASGSVFYITSDDEFIIKTLQHKEAEFLQKLLPGYYMNLNQNPRTLLPKFYGLFCYQCGGKNIRFCVMNNLLPSNVVKHEKYDLKGSTYKRKASKRELAKKSPTLKDLDFMEIHPDGILMDAETYNALMKTLQRDGRVLESFKIMDYSLLLAVHNLDAPDKDADGMPKSTSQDDGLESDGSGPALPPPRSESNQTEIQNSGLARGRSVKTRLAAYSTALESIHADSQANKHHHDNDDMPTGGIPARNTKGDRLLLFVGIIDILQNYRLRKKMEHTFKSIVHDGDTISVHRPSFYASRFLSFFSNVVFKKVTPPLKHSPSKKKAGWGRQRTVSHPHDEAPSRHGSKMAPRATLHTHEEQGAIGGRPDVLPAMSTPPPTFEEALSSRDHEISQSEVRVSVSRQSHQTETSISSRDITDGSRESAIMTYQTSERTSQGLTSQSPETRLNSGATSELDLRGHLHSPVPSNCESTPTHTEFTEGTPSYTASSPSIGSDTLENSPRPGVRVVQHHSTAVTTVTPRPSSSAPLTKGHYDEQPSSVTKAAHPSSAHAQSDDSFVQHITYL